MDAMNAPWRKMLCLISPLALVSCDSLPFMEKTGPDVVYALGDRDAFASPLQSPLKPAGAALEFDDESFDLSAGHIRILDQLAEKVAAGKGRYLIAGYTPPSLPSDYARAISERRAQAVRQHLIEHGVDATRMQTVGFGQDAGPAGPGSHVVVIYEEP
jgi:outer membrane protein OmpA-like peptidoglycan-associated protein